MMEMQQIGTGSVIQNNNPQIEPLQHSVNKYSRHERRKATFAIRNKTNGKFLKRTQKRDKITYSDVDISEASFWKYKIMEYLVGEVLVHSPNMDIEVRLVYRKNKQIQFK